MARLRSATRGTTSITWLHLSDLHMGCHGGEIWWQVRSEFRKSLREQFRPIDLILVTGDLTFSAQPEQFDLFDRFLGELLGWLREAGQESEPLIIPVPGNHDLARPPAARLRNYRILENFRHNRDHQEDLGYLRDELWQERDTSLFEPLFGNYVCWLETGILPRITGRPGVDVRRSHFPGDLGVFLDLPGRPPVTVVGLNSAWVQYAEGHFDGKIELFTQQLHAALDHGAGSSPVDALDDRLNLLLMHHPWDWLSPNAKRRFDEEIYPPDRFLCCLHGHMHKGRSWAISPSGGQFRYFFQAPSLFGLEHYGRSSETRAMGYAWGELDAAGTVRVWPFKRGLQGGQQVFQWDMEFAPDPAGHKVRPLAGMAAAAIANVDITPWLQALLDRSGFIEISGIGSGYGLTRNASRYPIEQLYTTLRSRDDTGSLAGRSGAESLAALMSRHPLLLIEGRPGAGKTTFLRLVTTMLARDLLGIPCPDGPSWRQRHLGLDGRAKFKVPLFLRLSELALLLRENEGRESGDDPRRLLDLLGRMAGVDDGEEWRRHWEGLLERGEAMLLLDGLDEVADDRLRQRVFTIFRDALRAWAKAPVVVTTRPFGAEAVRAMGFHHAFIEDFGREQVREFIERWVAALHELPIGVRPEGVAGEKSDRIISSVLGRPAIRRMAANPVMLTCLCVVHWNEGDLPEGRARLYAAVIRWLIHARSDLRKGAGFTDRFALKAFAALAFVMTGGPQGTKIAVVEFETAAEAVLPLIARHFPEEKSICRARDWLRFEALWSGIIEELPAGKVRFWHLSLQEYLAAQELAWRRDKEGAEDWWPVIKDRLHDLQWRETVDLLPGVLLDEGGDGRVDVLLRHIIELRGHRPSLANDARVFGILGRVLGPMTSYQYKPPPDSAQQHQDLQGRILPLFELEGAAQVKVETRIEAAEALGQGGDPRLTGDTFIEVPGTDIGLGKYPVTVMEYQAFVDAGGYLEQDYWAPPDWELRTRRRWEQPQGWERQLENPNRPVTGVSWYEACAYCQWLSREGDETFRLPSEAEWLAAAEPDGRKYPWGPEVPDLERANFGNNVGNPTPVGVYVNGDGAFGHCDLAGNVWEWMGDAGDDVGAGRRAHSAVRVVRGGSWSTPSGFLSSDSRRWDDPDNRPPDAGFRVARNPLEINRRLP